MKFSVRLKLILCAVLIVCFIIFIPVLCKGSADAKTGENGVLVEVETAEQCANFNHTPFYDLNPQEPVFRARFYTSFPTSTVERKSNISLAAKTLNNTLVPPYEEFSFNRVIGPRTEKRGYKTAKIIVQGEFVDGVGGGVCQVSTTLYNAVLLAGLTVTEYHPHSLPVSYVAPSFDAMVNSGNADLRFLNNTRNPVIIKARVEGDKLFVEIFGEPMTEKYVRESVFKGEIPFESEQIIFDEKGEYPDLYEGDRRVISYGKAGYKSEGYLTKMINGKKIWTKKLRRDSYSAVRGKVVIGTAKRPVEIAIEEVKNGLTAPNITGTAGDIGIIEE